MDRRLLSLLLLACTTACEPEMPVHERTSTKSKQCIECHYGAFVNVDDPRHAVQDGGSFLALKDPFQCATCHTTTGWIPANGSHPEQFFPITTGKHANPAIGCNDCHDPTKGPNTGGNNTDCIHCHIGAHTIPSVNAIHAAVGGYTPANEATPHSCLSCHPAGRKL
jgi:hypothetical protein